MYEAFYELAANPFQLTPDARYFFASEAHQKALSYLDYGISQGEGFVVITGDVGSGKSSLLSYYFPRLDQKHIVASKIITTQVDPTDAVRLALQGFGVLPKKDDKASVLAAFRSFLTRQYKNKRRVLLIIDEAQNLPRETLEEFRMLSNLEIEGQSLFQVFLVAQPQFMNVIADPDMEQLRQRIIASFHLGPMSLEDTRHYIEHRLRKAGWRGDPMITEPAYELIHKASDGVPRRVNTLTSRVLLLGALDRLHTIDAEKVQEVVDDLGEELTGRAQQMATNAPAANVPASSSAVGENAEQFDRLINAVERQASAIESLVEALRRLHVKEEPELNSEIVVQDGKDDHNAEF